MNTTTQRQAAFAEAASESFGRITRQRQAPGKPIHQLARTGDASNDHDFLRDAAMASGLRAMAANGFGSVDAGVITLPAKATSDFAFGESPLHYRTAGITNLVTDCAHWIAKTARAAYDAWYRQRLATATYRALSALDARMLQDIGFDRSELHSVVAELNGRVAATRIRFVRN